MVFCGRHLESFDAETRWRLPRLTIDYPANDGNENICIIPRTAGEQAKIHKLHKITAASCKFVPVGERPFTRPVETCGVLYDFNNSST